MLLPPGQVCAHPCSCFPGIPPLPCPFGRAIAHVARSLATFLMFHEALVCCQGPSREEPCLCRGSSPIPPFYAAGKVQESFARGLARSLPATVNAKTTRRRARGVARRTSWSGGSRDPKHKRTFRLVMCLVCCSEWYAFCTQHLEINREGL